MRSLRKKHVPFECFKGKFCDTASRVLQQMFNVCIELRRSVPMQAVNDVGESGEFQYLIAQSSVAVLW